MGSLGDFSHFISEARENRKNSVLLLVTSASGVRFVALELN